MINALLKNKKQEEITMKIQRRVQKYMFILSFAVLAGFVHQNTYAETRTNIQLYVPDDNENNSQKSNQTDKREDNGKADTSVVKTGDTTGGKILDYEILLAVSAVVGAMGVRISKGRKKEKDGD